jgi:hypothetical protein
MKHSVLMLGTLALLSTIGCGPPRLGVGPSEDDTESSGAGSDSTSSSEASTTSMETETSETSGDAWTSADFVPEKDMWMLNECDQFLQDCPEGEKCVPYSSAGGNWDASKCVPIMGDAKPGEPCWYGGIVEATDNCDASSICWDVMEIDGDAIGTCHWLCTGAPDNPECPVGSSCSINGSGVINVCIFGCDPLIQDCGSGLGCWWANGNFQCIFTTQDLPTGEPCGFINDCAIGHSCTAAEALPSCAGAACCAPFCELEQGDQPCEALPGTSCLPFFSEGEALPGYEHVGLCISP